MKYDARYWRGVRAKQRKRYLEARKQLRQRIYERASHDDATRRGYRD